MRRFENRNAIVTGAASGLGRAFALRLLREGATVAALDVRNLDALADEAGPALGTMHCDVTDEKQVVEALAWARADWGWQNLLFNNAGIGLGGTPLHELGLAEYDQVMGVNARGAFTVMKHALAAMVQSRTGGVIVNTASTTGQRPNMFNGAYGAAKSALMLMTRQAAIEYADRNIRINAVVPGLIDTPMLAGVDQDKLAMLASTIPMRRSGTPEEVAGVALFLASDDASYVTGACYAVDGGCLAA